MKDPDRPHGCLYVNKAIFVTMEKQEINNSAVYHKAKWVVLNPSTIYENGYVKVESGIITDIGRNISACDDIIIDHGSGAIMPALINAHTHLELSAFKNKLPVVEGGFNTWVRNLLELRSKTETETLVHFAEKEMAGLPLSGCIAVGEISSLGLTRDMFLNSNVLGVWFSEKIGNISVNERVEKNPGKIFSVAGHAPHTTSPELLCLLKNLTKKKQTPFSIHLAESDDEVEFLQTGKGEWADFLKERGVDFSRWGQFGNTPVDYLYKTGVLDNNTIAVHLLNVCEKDAKILADQQVNVCLCTRSNLYLHNRLPDIYMMKNAGVKMCMGTDSLASCDSLNLFEEMRFLANNFSDLLPEYVLSMATINGAAALGIENISGDINIKKRGAFIYVPVKVEDFKQVVETIVHYDFNGEIEAIGFE